MEKTKYIAKTSFGLEEILENELKVLGAKDLTIYKRAVEFMGDKNLLYQANLSLRTCLRILQPLFNFTAKNPEQLYKNVKEYNWNSFITPKDTIAIDGVVNSELFTHSKYAALKVKDAIVDQIRDKTGNRPNVELKNPTYRLNLHIEQNNCSILLDSSGDSLHKRGYRINGGAAPLNEVLAAGMIMLTGWNGKSNFVDLMCGSGTLIIEALMIAKNIAPNINREDFGFMNWKNFDKHLFHKVKKDLISRQRNTSFSFIGNDINKNVIDLAIENAKKANVFEAANFVVGDLKHLEHTLDSGILITNPPYDQRIKQENINTFYKEIGDTLKNKFNGFDAWIFSANTEALKHLGLRTSRRLQLYNGALETRFYNYKIYKGSKKAKYNE